ncbi:MAG: phosphoglycerate mutase family protein [Atopostipes suicloacalis]|nr:phosphoglycerate mutase family protein [Atopostipes suicloacalis]
MKIYVVRHGESQWNVENRLQGSDDSSLTEKGIRDNQELKKYLENSKIIFDSIYSSQSQRAIETAKTIRGNQTIEIKRQSALKEMSVGSWQGMTWPEIKKDYPIKYYQYWYQPDLYAGNNGGEDFYTVERRVVSFTNQLFQKKEAENILIISHGVIIKSMLNYLQNRSIKDFWKEPLVSGSSLTLIEKEGQKIEIRLIEQRTDLKKSPQILSE